MQADTSGVLDVRSCLRSIIGATVASSIAVTLAVPWLGAMSAGARGLAISRASSGGLIIATMPGRIAPVDAEA